MTSAPPGEPGAEQGRKITVTVDHFSLIMTGLAATFNLLAIGTVLAIFLAVILPRVNRGIEQMERAERAADEARREMVAMKHETAENRKYVVKTQEILERQYGDLSAQRETVQRLNAILRAWEEAAKAKAKKGG